MNKLLLIFMMMFLASSLMGAELRLSENFDDLSIDARLTTRIYGQWDIEPPVYSFGSGHGETGYSYGSGTSNEPFLEWIYGNTWYTEELYVSFWMIYPTFTWCGAGDNIKFFYPIFGSNDKWEFATNSNDGSLYMIYDNNASMQDIYGANSWGYPTLTNQADGNWHRYEFYINFDTGVIKFWYDRPEDNWTDGSYLKVSREFGSSWTTNYITLITIGSIDGSTPECPNASIYTRFFDDIEVWDGIPEDDSPSTPTIRAGGIRSGGIR